MLTENQLEDENARIKKMEAALQYKPPSNRNRTKCLKIKNSSRGLYLKLLVSVIAMLVTKVFMIHFSAYSGAD